MKINGHTRFDSLILCWSHFILKSYSVYRMAWLNSVLHNTFNILHTACAEYIFQVCIHTYTFGWLPWWPYSRCPVLCNDPFVRYRSSELCWEKGSSRECVMNVKNATDCFSSDFFLRATFSVTQQGVHLWVKYYVHIAGIQEEGTFAGGFIMIKGHADKAFLCIIFKDVLDTTLTTKSSRWKTKSEKLLIAVD